MTGIRQTYSPVKVDNFENDVMRRRGSRTDLSSLEACDIKQVN